MKKEFYWFEFAAIYLLSPVLIASGILSKEMIFPLLWLIFAYTLIILVRDKIPFFYWKISRREAMIVIKRFMLLAPFIVLFSLLVYPEKLFDFARREPMMWLIVLILYPLISVVVQEVVFRHFFFYRYHRIFKNKLLLILTNAALFSYAHIVFLNPVSLAFTFVGGIIFTLTYLRSRSLLLVCLEHALYGDLIFTIGLGSFFYHGTF